MFGDNQIVVVIILLGIGFIINIMLYVIFNSSLTYRSGFFHRGKFVVVEVTQTLLVRE